LDVEGANGLNVAQLAGEDHLAGLPDQRIAGVIVREGEDTPDDSTAAISFSAWSRLNVIGLSQTTLKPASIAALAMS